MSEKKFTSVFKHTKNADVSSNPPTTTTRSPSPSTTTTTNNSSTTLPPAKQQSVDDKGRKLTYTVLCVCTLSIIAYPLTAITLFYVETELPQVQNTVGGK
jgi:hypothetical protein